MSDEPERNLGEQPLARIMADQMTKFDAETIHELTIKGLKST